MNQSYRSAGVNIDTGNEFVRRIKPIVASTHRAEIIGGIGGFSGMMTIPPEYKNPVIVAATDGVGTKLTLAKQYRRHELIGQDLVAMSVNDVLCTGAEPLAFLDYFATGKLEPETAMSVVAGIANACKLAGCSLLGGETAEMPGFYRPGTYDLAGFCIGIVESDAILTPKHVTPGDKILGIRSDGPHSNGYSLIRAILEFSPQPPAEVLEQILAPTRIPAKGLLAVRHLVTGIAHITGGGLIDNVPRMLPKGCAAAIDLSSWEWNSAFHWLQKHGELQRSEMLRTFNCGICFALATPPEHAVTVQETLQTHGESVVEIGAVRDASEIPDRHKGFLVLGRENQNS